MTTAAGKLGKERRNPCESDRIAGGRPGEGSGEETPRENPYHRASPLCVAVRERAGDLGRPSPARPLTEAIDAAMMIMKRWKMALE